MWIPNPEFIWDYDSIPEKFKINMHNFVDCDEEGTRLEQLRDYLNN